MNYEFVSIWGILLNIAGSTNGRSSLSESENFGPNPSPAAAFVNLVINLLYLNQ